MEATHIEKKADMVVAVDLTPLRPGGANGGIKPAIFRMLSEAQRLAGDSLVFVFLTRSSTHAEVRGLARRQDIILCVLQDPESPICLSGAQAPAEFSLFQPLADLLKVIGVDLLYAPFGACTFHAEGVPSMALIVDLLHRDYPHSLTSAQIAEREAYIAQTLQCASMIQCISRSGVERLMAHYQVPEEKLFYTYLPVHVRLDAPASPSTEGLPEMAAPYFFYPANLWKHKNHETLLLAYRLYRQQAGDAAWDLVLTFHEDARAVEIRGLARALGLEPYLHCPGYVSEAGLRVLWQHAGALVFPSLHEGFGIPLVEAMHYGVPIVTGPDFSLKEIAGDAACFVDPRKPESIADALLKVSRDAVLREAMRCRGKERLGFFDLAIETRKLLEAWRACVGRKEGFPRKATVLEAKAVLALPTPASDALWTLEVRVNPQFPQNRYAFYLDDAAQGSFSCSQNGSSVFHFDCRPGSRVLRVVITRDRTVAGISLPVSQGAIEAIVFKRPEGPCFALFEKKEGGAL